MSTATAPAPLTDRQREFLIVIVRHYRREHTVPTYRETAAAMGVSSLNGVRQTLLALAKKGHLVLGPKHSARGYRLPALDAAPNTAAAVDALPAAPSASGVPAVPAPDRQTDDHAPPLARRLRPPLDFRCTGERLVCGDRSVAAGEVVYVLAVYLVQQREVTVRATKRKVWGRVESVPTNTLTQLCVRLNQKLAAIGSSARAAVADGVVLLIPQFVTPDGGPQ